MSEPQNDEYVEEIQHVETNDSVSDSETDNQVQDESNEQAEPIVDEVEVAKQKANDAFNKQYGEKKQLERELEAQKARVAEFENKQREEMAANVGNIPALPDAFDDDYEQKIQARDEAIRAQAQFNYSQQSHQQAQQAVQQQAAQAREQDVHVSMESYTRKATELGIKQEELQAAGNKVGSYGLSEDLVMHILKDTDGPLITKHLAANPQDGYELASMSPFAVGQFLDGIKQKASALKPKTSNAPKPATNLQGNGVDPEAGKYRNLKGTRYE
tara:strand:+ start:218 stop:1033 length:816 start_codon:yes stop_codon:yes gene_type:complete